MPFRFRLLFLSAVSLLRPKHMEAPALRLLPAADTAAYCAAPARLRDLRTYGEFNKSQKQSSDH